MIMFLLAAMLPAFILFWYVYSRDITPEPRNVVARGFFYGALATVVSTFISAPLLRLGLFQTEPSTFWGAFRTAFFGAAIPEETAKLLMLWLLLRRCKDFDERYDGLVYAAAIGLGFATLENILYLASSGFGFFQVAFSRAILAVPGHFGFAVVMGYYYSLNHFDRYRAPGAGIKMWLYPVLGHGLYDTIAMSQSVTPQLSGVIAVAILLLCFWGLKWARVHMTSHLLADSLDQAGGIDEQ